MIINTNAAALNTYNKFNKSDKKLRTSLERLASGKRINQAADDAAGLAISQKMKAQARGTVQAQRNVQDGVSLLQTAEGGAKEVHVILQRMRELTVQAANDTLTNGERNNIKQEIASLKNEVNNIAKNTEFNNMKLLDGTQSKMQEQTFSAPYIKEFEITANPSSEGSLGVANDITTTHAKFEFVEPADKDGVWIEIDIGNSIGDSLSNLENEFYAIKSGASGSPGNQSAIANMDIHIVDNKVIITSDDPFTSSHYPAKGIQGARFSSGSPGELTVKYDNPDGGINIQTGANSGNNLEVNISGITVSDLGLNQINVSNHSLSSASIDTLDNAIRKVSELRSDLGSYQNRLDHTSNNLSNYETNIEASNSRIEDVDMAKEMVEMSKQQILSQAGTAMLAQANNLPQGVLQLIS